MGKTYNFSVSLNHLRSISKPLKDGYFVDYKMLRRSDLNSARLLFFDVKLFGNSRSFPEL